VYRRAFLAALALVELDYPYPRGWPALDALREADELPEFRALCPVHLDSKRTEALRELARVAIGEGLFCARIENEGGVRPLETPRLGIVAQGGSVWVWLGRGDPAAGGVGITAHLDPDSAELAARGMLEQAQKARRGDS